MERTAKAALAGFRALIVGTLVLVVLLAALEPSYGWTAYLGHECTHANGEAGPFAYTGWGYGLWYGTWCLLAMITAEQFAPLTRRGRSRHEVLIRSSVALAIGSGLALAIPYIALTCN